MAQASVLVGIATCDRAGILPKAIDSALAQSYRPLRVAVVDDASSDTTPQLRQAYPNVSWQRCDTRRGYVAARNAMMLNAGEDYYVSLDDDSWFLAGDEIAVAVDLFERNAKVAAVAFDIASPDQPALRKRGQKASVSLFIGCGHVLRLSAVKALGGYGQYPGGYGGEERDFCLRLIDAGYAIVKLDGVHVWHNKTTTARDMAAQRRSAVCNDLAFTMRRSPLVLMLPALGYKIAAHILFALRSGLVGSSLQGIGDFFASAGKTWQMRKAVRVASLMRYQALARSPQVMSD
jgi:GT2 family glycosyltransferase